MSDRDDDPERALGRGLGSSVLRIPGVCPPVVVLVFERSVLAWPESVARPKQKLSVCHPCREHKSRESCYWSPFPHPVKLHVRSNQKKRGATDHKPRLQIWSQWVENWTNSNDEANPLEGDNRQWPSRGSTNVRCEGRRDGRFDLGQWIRFAQKIL